MERNSIMVRKQLKSGIKGKIACAAAAAIVGPSMAQAALLIDVRASAVVSSFDPTAPAVISNGGKTVVMHEGDVVTFTTSVKEVPNFGLASFDLSLRTRNETIN